jgi:hypothetical protein
MQNNVHYFEKSQYLKHSHSLYRNIKFWIKLVLDTKSYWKCSKPFLFTRFHQECIQTFESTKCILQPRYILIWNWSSKSLLLILQPWGYFFDKVINTRQTFRRGWSLLVINTRQTFRRGWSLLLLPNFLFNFGQCIYNKNKVNMYLSYFLSS